MFTGGIGIGKKERKKKRKGKKRLVFKSPRIYKRLYLNI